MKVLNRLQIADIPTGSTNIILGATTSGNIVQANNNIRHYSIGLGVSANGIITTGAKTRKTISVAGTIVGYKLVADKPTNAVVDIWIRGGSIPTDVHSITASAKPTLTAAEYVASTTLTGWTTSVVSTSIIIIEVESNSAANYLYLELYMNITI